mmetsp:Transcript_28812/g.66417  ORF Transcript_28812/g.66417 Transcript_28812/m.66417 type:complete len:369 (+) Transcript_28812:56-1162(+)
MMGGPPSNFATVRMAIPVPSVCLSKGARGKALELMCGAGVHDPGACPLHVRCPLGHEMAAKAASEVVSAARIIRTCTSCTQCGGVIDKNQEVRHLCKLCGLTYCLPCAESVGNAQNRRPSISGDTARDVMPGDILFLGPDPRFNIHHVVLCRSRMRAADYQIVGMLPNIPPGGEVLQCHMIESTQASCGTVTAWYAAIGYFLRYAGGFTMIAEMSQEDSSLAPLEPPVPVKVLMHPLRGELLDKHLFNEAVMWGASQATSYGKRQAVKAFMATLLHRDNRIDADEYQDLGSRIALREELHARWEARPICSSLCIKVWQMYFELLGRASGSVEKGIIETLRWMPVYNDKTTPSVLLKTLTRCGWQLRTF